MCKITPMYVRISLEEDPYQFEVTRFRSRSELLKIDLGFYPLLQGMVYLSLLTKCCLILFQINNGHLPALPGLDTVVSKILTVSQEFMRKQKVCIKNMVISFM